jgi:hypothetical protein
MTDGKRDGMDRAERHADPHWWQCMLECGKIVAERKPYFNTDDIVQLRQRLHPNATTHEHRAIGPLMAALARLGYCERTDDWVESQQSSCHSRPMRVWFSMIYRGPAVRRPTRRRPLDPRQIPLF